MDKVKNAFEAILKYGHDEDSPPQPEANFESADAPAGSPEKIEILRKRIEAGLPLWHDNDRYDYNGLTGAVRPREQDDRAQGDMRSTSPFSLSVLVDSDVDPDGLAQFLAALSDAYSEYSNNDQLVIRSGQLPVVVEAHV